MQPTDNGAALLLQNLLIQACKDAVKGDLDARSWLATTGALVATKLGIVYDAQKVRDWAEDPTVPQTVTLATAAQETGVNRGRITNAIHDGMVGAHPDLMRRQVWRVDMPSLRRWIEYTDGGYNDNWRYS